MSLLFVNFLILIVLSGTKSAPREIVLENSILPKDPGFIRVSTPPRVITLDHPFYVPQHENEMNEDARYFEPKNLHFSDDDVIKGNKNSKNSHHNSQELIINHRYALDVAFNFYVLYSFLFQR
jgi:hypothetical protein